MHQLQKSETTVLKSIADSFIADPKFDSEEYSVARCKRITQVLCKKNEHQEITKPIGSTYK